MIFRKKHRREAIAFLTEHMDRYRAKPIEQLLRLLDEQDTFEIKGDSGKEYQIEIDARWYDEQGGALQICGGIDDGWLTAYINVSPFLQSFIVNPDGTVVEK